MPPSPDGTLVPSTGPNGAGEALSRRRRRAAAAPRRPKRRRHSPLERRRPLGPRRAPPEPAGPHRPRRRRHRPGRSLARDRTGRSNRDDPVSSVRISGTRAPSRTRCRGFSPSSTWPRGCAEVPRASARLRGPGGSALRASRSRRPTRGRRGSRRAAAHARTRRRARGSGRARRGGSGRRDARPRSSSSVVTG